MGLIKQKMLEEMENPATLVLELEMSQMPLNDWELEFLGSVKRRVENLQSLSGAQMRVLSELVARMQNGNW